MRRALALVVAAVVLAACEPGDAVALGAADAGRAVEIAMGRTFTVTLVGNPSTGFDWLIASDIGPVLALVSKDVRPGSGLVGAPADVAFRFRAAEAGRGRIELVYRRSWESIPPERTFVITIVVR